MFGLFGGTSTDLANELRELLLAVDRSSLPLVQLAERLRRQRAECRYARSISAPVLPPSTGVTCLNSPNPPQSRSLTTLFRGRRG